MNLCRELESACKFFVGVARHRFALLSASLAAINPYLLLKRGYLMATDAKGGVVTSVKKIKKGQSLVLQFKDGKASAVIEQIVKEAFDAKD
jgi:exodeoxyribonuclease VII large subunit